MDLKRTVVTDLLAAPIYGDGSSDDCDVLERVNESSAHQPERSASHGVLLDNFFK
jgi:hypothetical protein